MKQNFLNILVIILILGAVVISQSVFTVDQREQALVLQLGNPIGEPRKPGIHFKIPLIQEVKRFDGRVLSVDPAPEQVVIASSTIVREKSREELQNERLAAQEAPTEATEETAEVEATPAEQPAERPTIQNVSGEPIIVDSFARYKIVDPLQFLKTLGTISIAKLPS